MSQSPDDKIIGRGDGISLIHEAGSPLPEGFTPRSPDDFSQMAMNFHRKGYTTKTRHSSLITQFCDILAGMIIDATQLGRRDDRTHTAYDLFSIR